MCAKHVDSHFENFQKFYKEKMILKFENLAFSKQKLKNNKIMGDFWGILFYYFKGSQSTKVLTFKKTKKTKNTCLRINQSQEDPAAHKHY